MIEHSKVAEQFGMFAGLQGCETERWTGVCTSAADELDRLVIADADRTVWGQRLIMAAAALAYYRYALVAGCEGGGQEVRLGDISVKGRGDSVKTALKIKEEFLDLVRPVLRESCPAFIQVG